MGLLVEIRKNLDYRQMDEELRVFSRAKYQEDAEMCMVIVMAHGDEGKIFCVDYRIVSSLYLHRITAFSRLTNTFSIFQFETEDIYKRFNNRNCPALIGKPKVFIIQSCRGSNEDYLPTSGFLSRFSRRNAHSDSDANPFTSARPGSGRGDPCQKDILILESTIPGFVSYRDPNVGSWLVTCLDQVFRQFSDLLDIVELFNKVSEIMEDMTTEKGAKQMPEVRTRGFYKKLWFKPNFEMDPEEDKENRNIGNRAFIEETSSQCHCVIQ